MASKIGKSPAQWWSLLHRKSIFISKVPELYTTFRAFIIVAEMIAGLMAERMGYGFLHWKALDMRKSKQKPSCRISLPCGRRGSPNVRRYDWCQKKSFPDWDRLNGKTVERTAHFFPFFPKCLLLTVGGCRRPKISSRHAGC